MVSGLLDAKHPNLVFVSVPKDPTESVERYKWNISDPAQVDSYFERLAYVDPQMIQPNAFRAVFRTFDARGGYNFATF